MSLQPTGSRVELVEPLYGYDVGARGVVVRRVAGDPEGEDSSVVVCLDGTGHAVQVGVSSLRPL